MLDRIL